MRFALTYEEARDRHPELVADIEAQVRKSRSKYKNLPPAQLDWAYSWCVSVEGYSLGDLLSGKAAEDQAKHAAMSLDERLADYEKRCHCSLEASKKQLHRFVYLAQVPAEVLDQYRAQQLEDIEERERLAAMTPEEREALREQQIKQAMGPGFVALRFSGPKE